MAEEEVARRRYRWRSYCISIIKVLLRLHGAQLSESIYCYSTSAAAILGLSINGATESFTERTVGSLVLGHSFWMISVIAKAILQFIPERGIAQIYELGDFGFAKLLDKSGVYYNLDKAMVDLDPAGQLLLKIYPAGHQFHLLSCAVYCSSISESPALILSGVIQDKCTADDHQEDEELALKKLLRNDSLAIEATKVNGSHTHHSKVNHVDWPVILHLAFQSIGIVYGDIGTSPLYVFASTFSEDGIKHEDDILGVLSLIIYTITLITLVKYVFIVLQANDNGDGGTFALYSLICRYAKVGLVPSEEAEDKDVSTFSLQLPDIRMHLASNVKSKLENSQFAKYFLLLATMLGTSMVIGDGVLTPSISVLSAVEGIKLATPSMTEDRIVWAAVAILVCLFVAQRFGTDRVGYTFAPIICVWFALLGGIGVFNFMRFDSSVAGAINPLYIVEYFKRNKEEAWISLGGIVLAITGTEALFADVGHFTVQSIRISMCAVTYPALILAYTGQAAFLRAHPELVEQTFFRSVPDTMYWPMFVMAILAAIIASQAMISGAFATIQHSLSLGCFPRVKVVHTSAKYPGQVYIPEVNYLLMLASVGVTLGFRTTAKIGNAYGIAVVLVMTLTSSFLVLIMIMIWKTNIFLVLTYILVIGSVELMYLSSVLYKFNQGGYLPLAFAAVLTGVMYIWNSVYRKKYHYEVDHKTLPEEMRHIAADKNFRRLPGLAVFYSELVQGIPPIFKHYVTNIPAIHSVLVFVSIKSLPISKVPLEERFLFRRVEPRELNVFRCVVRYGYTDVRNEAEPFEALLVERVKDFIRDEFWTFRAVMGHNGIGEVDTAAEEAVEGEIEVVERARVAGVVHLVGESEVVAGKGAGLGKRVMIDHAYNFLKRNLIKSEVYDIPHERMLKVGMTYQL